MWEFFRKLFSTDFMPHGHCYFWQPDVVWLHVASDSMIGLAYYSIPVTLYYFVRRRRDLAFEWMFLLFAIFILACGTTHFLNVWTLWTPMYRFDGVVKLLTAIASVVTAILLIPLVPRALALPSPEALRQANEALANEVRERRAAEEMVRTLNAELERRVQERTAQLTRSNQDLQQFAYIASHDLQEPLRTVASYTQLLARRYQGQLDADADEFIAYTVQGVLRMQALIDDLLAYSRLEVVEDRFVTVDAREAVQTALNNLDMAIRESGARIDVGPLPTLTADAAQLAQIFQNLLSNAIKYRSSEQPRIRIASLRQQNGWQFSVSDNGIGIDSRFKDQLFLIFRRLHGREYPGTGLGLAICKRIVLRHGGTIWVESELGKGSVFCFTIPDRLPQSDQIPQERSSA